MRISIYPRPHDKRAVYLKALRWWDRDEETIRRSIPAIQPGDIAVLENAR